MRTSLLIKPDSVAGISNNRPYPRCKPIERELPLVQHATKALPLYIAFDDYDEAIDSGTRHTPNTMMSLVYSQTRERRRLYRTAKKDSLLTI